MNDWTDILKLANIIGPFVTYPAMIWLYFDIRKWQRELSNERDTTDF